MFSNNYAYDQNRPSTLAGIVANKLTAPNDAPPTSSEVSNSLEFLLSDELSALRERVETRRDVVFIGDYSIFAIDKVVYILVKTVEGPDTEVDYNFEFGSPVFENRVVAAIAHVMYAVSMDDIQYDSLFECLSLADLAGLQKVLPSEMIAELFIMSCRL